MKQIKHLLAMAAMLLFAASCSSDEPVDPVNPVVDKDQTRYLSVAISSPAGTRVGNGFNDGSEAESKIDNIVFVFYDINGNYLSHTPNITDGKQDWEGTNTNSVERIWKRVVAVNLVQGQNIPAYVLALVNATDLSIAYEQKSLNEVRDIDIEASLNKNGTFPMTNSVYYAVDPFMGGDKVKIAATPIQNKTLFTSETDAQTALETPNSDGILEIFVERFAARISLTLNDDDIQDYTKLKSSANNNTVTLKFVPEYWRPNAVDYKSFIIKKFALPLTNGTGYNPAIATYNEVDALFPTGNSLHDVWNDETNHRSYWACSPSFYTNTYPNVSDDVNDLENADQADKYLLKYFSYKEIKTGVNNIFDKGVKYNNAATNGDQGVFYTRESTTHLSAINNIKDGNPAASVASVVLVGHYLVDNETAAHTFYINNGIYYADETAAKNKFINDQNLLYTGNTTGADKVTDANLFVIEHPKAAVRGETAVAGRFVTLQLKEAPTTPIYYRSGNEYYQVTDTNINDVNRMLWRAVHMMEMYYNGLAFFNIPIRHLGYPANDEAAKAANLIDDAGQYQWKNMRRGDFGVVRNHAYSIKISGITGLATGLRSDEQPIVPPKDAANYYVAARLNVLAWQVVPQQEVGL